MQPQSVHLPDLPSKSRAVPGETFEEKLINSFSLRSLWQKNFARGLFYVFITIPFTCVLDAVFELCHYISLDFDGGIIYVLDGAGAGAGMML